MMYSSYALAGLTRNKCQRAMMKIQVNHIMSWKVKDCCNNYASQILSCLSLNLDMCTFS